MSSLLILAPHVLQARVFRAAPFSPSYTFLISPFMFVRLPPSPPSNRSEEGNA